MLWDRELQIYFELNYLMFSKKLGGTHCFQESQYDILFPVTSTTLGEYIYNVINFTHLHYMNTTDSNNISLYKLLGRCTIVDITPRAQCPGRCTGTNSTALSNMSIWRQKNNMSKKIYKNVTYVLCQKGKKITANSLKYCTFLVHLAIHFGPCFEGFS